jgi:DNA polymerase III delta prime subunit
MNNYKNINFINKYQPNNFDNIILEDKLKNILQNLINNNLINLLFVGDIGSGKTTIIKCILNEYFKLDYNIYKSNILYVNNLKEQGIHNLRQDVKIFIQTSSTIKHKNKFIIIDDIDTLNEQTQQILRNAIDNYDKIHFIATCNNLQNVVDNIQSRLNIFRLHLPSYTSLKNICYKICQKEDINIDDKSIHYIIKTSNNSFRILLNHLQKIKLLDKHIFDVNNLDSICCNIKYIDFDKLILFCKNGDIKNSYKIINNFIDNGYSIIDIYESFFNYIKVSDYLTNNQIYKILPIICKYITIFYTIHENNIELKLFIHDLIKIF